MVFLESINSVRILQSFEAGKKVLNRNSDVVLMITFVLVGILYILNFSMWNYLSVLAVFLLLEKLFV